jgi:hypothetical protein
MHERVQERRTASNEERAELHAAAVQAARASLTAAGDSLEQLLQGRGPLGRDTAPGDAEARRSPSPPPPASDSGSSDEARAAEHPDGVRATVRYDAPEARPHQ